MTKKNFVLADKLKVYSVITNLPPVSDTNDTSNGKAKFEKGAYLSHGHILIVLSDKLYDILTTLS